MPVFSHIREEMETKDNACKDGKDTETSDNQRCNTLDQRCNTLDQWTQTDPVMVLPLTVSEINPTNEQSIRSASVTPIFKCKSRRKANPRKVEQQNNRTHSDEEAFSDPSISVDSSPLPWQRAGSPQVLQSANTIVSKTTLNGWTDHMLAANSQVSDLNDDLAQLSKTPQQPLSLRENSEASKVESSPLLTTTTEEEFLRGRFKCLLCSYANNHKVALELHSIIHESQPPYKCKRCQFVTAEPLAINLHIKQHTGEQRFICQHAGCDYSSNNSSNMKRHAKSHKESLNKSSLQAKLSSSADSPGDSSLSSLSNSCVNSSTVDSTDSSMENTTLLSQLVKVVNGITSTDLPMITKDITASPTPPEVLKCDQCEYHTPNPTNLRRHKIKHRTHRSHKCFVCTYTTNYLGNMRRHFEVRHKGIPFDKPTADFNGELKSAGIKKEINGYLTSLPQRKRDSNGCLNVSSNKRLLKQEVVGDTKEENTNVAKDKLSSSLALLQQMVLGQKT